jgi:hypothetical protein
VCEKSGYISYVMLRSAATKNLGGVFSNHPRFFAESILSPDMIGAEGLRMTSHTPFQANARRRTWDRSFVAGTAFRSST